MQEGLLVIDRYTMVLSVNSSVGKLLKVKEVKTGESVYLLNRSRSFEVSLGRCLKESMRTRSFVWMAVRFR